MLIADTFAVTALDRLRKRLNDVLRGKEDVVHLVLVALLSRGHLLLEDRPGLGKTTLAKALANALGERFARIQCTPDLLPGDITGFAIFNQKTQEFEFREGPVFSEILLADEINRATPRTQSALLEAMAERQVTVDSQRYKLPSHFFVIATQNPIDQHGTYPLPEAQLDRFAMKLSIGYPDQNHELKMLAETIRRDVESEEDIEPVFEPGQLVQLQQQVAALHVDSRVQEYMVQLSTATRNHPHVTLGMSPRGLLTWQRAAQAHAFLEHRDFVIPDDVQATAVPVLQVRLGVDHDNPAALINDLLASHPVPEYSLPQRQGGSR